MVNQITLFIYILVLIACKKAVYTEAIENGSKIIKNGTITSKNSLQIIHKFPERLDKTKKPVQVEEKYLNLSHIQELIDRTRNATRDLHVLHTLNSAAGVYTDKQRGIAAGLQKTVFMTIISYNAKAGLYQYKIYFRNFLCFAQHYGIDLIVYILHHTLPDVEEVYMYKYTYKFIQTYI